MKRGLGLALSLGVLVALYAFVFPSIVAGKGTLATISGSVKDDKGNPLAGAVISLLKAGADEVIKQTTTGSDGRFTAKISPGRYGIRAIADGFSEVVFCFC